ncbi:hypothetical protein X011_16710 [Mycobacterium tuberculosis variant microti OV254]|nr:hypothetical protein X011_16710 [Mycobacterium tuberculosis variant microti OV254]BBX43482.1 hypothetical protein MSIM_49330 [Mycobacterium simiae]
MPRPSGVRTDTVLVHTQAITVDTNSCRSTNRLTMPATHDFLDGLQVIGQRFEQAAGGRQAAVSDHNRPETPLFAVSIERRALATTKHSTT